MMDLQPDVNEDEDELTDEVEEIARAKPEGFFDHGGIDLEDLFVDMSSLAGVETDDTIYPYPPHLSEPDEGSVEPVLESYDKKAAQLVDGCLVCKKCRTKNPLMVNKCSGCGAQFRR